MQKISSPDTFAVIALSTGDQSVTNLYCGEQRCSQVWLWLPNPHLRHTHTSAPLNLLWLSPALVLSLIQYFYTFFLGMLGSQEDKSKDSNFIGAWKYKEKPNSVFLYRRSSFTWLFLSLLNNPILAESNTKQQVTVQLPVCTVVCIIYEAGCAVCIQNQISLLVLQHCSVNPPPTLSPTPLPVSGMRVWVDL